MPTPSKVVRLDVRQERVLARIIEAGESDRKKPTPGPSNGERNTQLYPDPMLQKLLDEIEVDIRARDALVPLYEKAEAAARAASGKSMTLYRDIQRLDARAAKTREAFEVLKTRNDRRPF